MKAKIAALGGDGIGPEVVAQAVRVLEATARLFDHEFTITPLHTRTKPEVLTGQFVKGSRKLYNTLVILGHLLDIVCPAHRWRERLRTLLERHQVPVAAMDFPGNWQARSIWRQEAAA